MMHSPLDYWIARSAGGVSLKASQGDINSSVMWDVYRVQQLALILLPELLVTPTRYLLLVTPPECVVTSYRRESI